MISRFHFCPRCHRKNVAPEWILKSSNNIKGNINIKCSYCPGTIKIQNKVEIVEEVKE